MAITIQKIITVQEFKESEIFDTTFGQDSITFSDNFILEAITMASINMDQLTGFTLFEKLPNLSDSLQNFIKMGACKYVLHLLRKGVEYMRGSGTSNLGNSNFSSTNPEDPYYMPPEVFASLSKAKLLADFAVGSFKTPANYNNLFPYYTTPKDPIYEDGNFPVSVKEGNAWYVRYDKVQSSDKTVVITFGNDVSNKHLDLSVDTSSILGQIETDPTFNTVVMSAVAKKLPEITTAVGQMILQDEALIELLEKAIEDKILNDEEWTKIFENAVAKLLEDNSDFIIQLIAKVEPTLTTNISATLKGDTEFTTAISNTVATTLGSNQDFINGIATNKTLIDSVIASVGASLNDLLNTSFTNLVKTIDFPELD